MPQNIENLEIRENEVNDILGKAPSWIVRWGITLIGIIIITIFTGSFFFKYPDTVSGNVVVTTANIPAELVSRTSGKLQELKVTNNQVVKKAELLAVIENTSDYTTLLQVKNILESYIKQKEIDFLNTNIKKYKNSNAFGELQTYYSSVIKALDDYNFIFERNYLVKKINNIEIQIQRYQSVANRIQQQCKTASEQFDLAKSQFKRDSMLYASKTTSALDFETAKAKFLQEKQAYETSKTSVDNTLITIAELEQNKLDFQQQLDEQIQKAELNLQLTVNEMLTQIKAWEQTYLIVSPIDGKVSFSKYWTSNQNIKTGDVVLTVLPEKEMLFTVKMQIPQQGAGKIKSGNKVNIRIDNFPYMEYGMLKGKVKAISYVTDNNMYIADVELTNGLNTTYKKQLPLITELRGSAEIITEDFTVIQRMVQPLKHLFKNQTE